MITTYNNTHRWQASATV